MSGEGVIPAAKPLLYCSFCGKDQHAVAKLIAGPTSFICDECISLCNDIIAEEASKRAEPAGPVFTLDQEARIREIIAEARPQSAVQVFIDRLGNLTRLGAAVAPRPSPQVADPCQ